MPGSKRSAAKTRDTILSKDPDFYKRIGSIGGKKEVLGRGFAGMTKEKVKQIGSKGGKIGGKISKRGSRPLRSCPPIVVFKKANLWATVRRHDERVTSHMEELGRLTKKELYERIEAMTSDDVHAEEIKQLLREYTATILPRTFTETDKRVSTLEAWQNGANDALDTVYHNAQELLD